MDINKAIVPQIGVIRTRIKLKGALICVVCFREVVHHETTVPKRSPNQDIVTVDLKRFLVAFHGLGWSQGSEQVSDQLRNVATKALSSDISKNLKKCWFSMRTQEAGKAHLQIILFFAVQSAKSGECVGVKCIVPQGHRVAFDRAISVAKTFPH